MSSQLRLFSEPPTPASISLGLGPAAVTSTQSPLGRAPATDTTGPCIHISKTSHYTKKWGECCLFGCAFVFCLKCTGCTGETLRWLLICTPKSVLPRVCYVEEAVFVFLFLVDSGHERGFLREMILDKEKHGTLGWKLDTLPNHESAANKQTENCSQENTTGSTFSKINQRPIINRICRCHSRELTNSQVCWY